MTNSSTSTIIIGVILGLVIFFNIAVVFMTRKNQDKITKKYKNYSSMLNNLNNPYKKEDNELDKLSGLVNKIKKDEQEKKQQ